MFKEFSENEKDDDYLSEFRQKIANQQHEDMEERRQELQRSRNGFIGTLAGIVLAGIVSWILLAPRFSGQDVHDIPVIRRPITPAKIQPSEPGGMEIQDQDKSVYDLVEKKEIQEEKIESILPEPEAPQMPVIVPEPEAAPAEETTESSSVTSNEVAEPHKEVASTPEKQGQNISESENKVENPEGALAPVSDVQNTAKPEVSAAPKQEAVSTAVNKAQPAAEAPTQPEPEKAKPAASAAEPMSAPVSQTVTKTPAVSVPLASETVMKQGVWQIQLIASTNKKATEDAWRDLSATYSGLKNLPHEIESADNGNGKLFHRLKAGAFADRAPADKICAEIKQAGGSCIVKQK